MSDDANENPLARLHRRRFQFGQLTITPQANDLLSEREVLVALGRHVQCDWGDCCREDQVSNDAALIKGGRLFSAYKSDEGQSFWVITEADRSYTTVLLPSDY